MIGVCVCPLYVESLTWSVFLLFKVDALLGAAFVLGSSKNHFTFLAVPLVGDTLCPFMPCAHQGKWALADTQEKAELQGFYVCPEWGAPTWVPPLCSPLGTPGRKGMESSLHSPTWLAAPFCLSFSSTWHFFLAILWRIEAFSLNLPGARQSVERRLDEEEERGLWRRVKYWQSIHTASSVMLHYCGDHSFLSNPGALGPAGRVPYLCGFFSPNLFLKISSCQTIDERFDLDLCPPSQLLTK